MINMENKKYFTEVERLEALKEVIKESKISGYHDLFQVTFNSENYVKSPEEAEKALNDYGTFKAIKEVEGYEKDLYNEVYTSLSSPEEIANMLYFILGKDTLWNNHPELEDAYYSVLNQKVNEENNQVLLEVINKLIDELE